MAPLRSAANAISVAPRPGRRSTVKPRDSSSCENISASRYDSPNGFDATVTPDFTPWPRAVATTVIAQSAVIQCTVRLMIPAPPVLLSRARSAARRIRSLVHEPDRACCLSARFCLYALQPPLPPAGLLRRDRE